MSHECLSSVQASCTTFNHHHQEALKEEWETAALVFRLCSRFLMSGLLTCEDNVLPNYTLVVEVNKNPFRKHLIR